MKTFKINDKYEITCNQERTRYGFRHLANLYRTGLSGTSVLIEKAKACYYNRTWESFEYESVISDLLGKANIMTPEEKKNYLNLLRKNDLEEINKQFGFISGLAKLGDILCNTQKDKNDWKTRMLKAGLSDKGLIMPEDWDTLSEDDKENRLNNVINQLK